MGSILVGAITATTYLCAVMLAVDKKLNRYNIVIDAANKQVRIKCGAHEISPINFKVYTRIDKNNLFLYVKGSQVLENSKDIVSVDHKYKLKHIDPNDLRNMNWEILNNELTVIIPITTVRTDISVKKIR